MFHPEYNENEKRVIRILARGREFSYQEIADQLNHYFTHYNRGSRHRWGIYRYLKRVTQ